MLRLVSGVYSELPEASSGRRERRGDLRLSTSSGQAAIVGPSSRTTHPGRAHSGHSDQATLQGRILIRMELARSAQAPGQTRMHRAEYDAGARLRLRTSPSTVLAV